ncbi:attractin-like protein 1 isoform X1 [Macrobrachium rosenbergii]|uniref:attractin-like protein 1 isoform X1 n=1 Tax=Macrobrachium rosenbergii TaxID=79674 RepID=UPI0034D39368
MAADLQKFLFKSKFLRKFHVPRGLVVVIILLNCALVCCEGQEECTLQCEHGRCVENNKCLCDQGWKGPLCQWCEGRLRLFANSSTITDGSGNYSTDTQCAWLIDAGKPNTSIRLHLDHFATECSWDHLYVYDGDSIYDPLIAVFSGMVVQDDYRVTHIPEVVASSGYALLYFYSDAAYNLTGFSISYRIDGCPSTVAEKVCSSKGVCIDGVCTCDAGWGGPACSVPLCPEECSGHGTCNPEQHSCQCHEGYKGADCSQVKEAGWWEVVGHDVSSELDHPSPASSLLERSSHATVLINNEIWVIGGYSFTEKPFLLRYNIAEDKWTSVETKSIKEPSARYGHTAVVYNESIYMYGGMKADGTIARELWRLDVDTLKWAEISSNRGLKAGRGRGNRRGRVGRRERNKRNNNGLKDKEENLSYRHASEDENDDHEEDEDDDKEEEKSNPKSRQESSGCSSPGPCAPIHCVGHAAVVVQKTKRVMLVFFGHSDRYGYLNTVQEYDFDQNTWTTLETRGAVVYGVYGHTALWDPVTSLVYIHGGLRSIKTQGHVVSDLMTFDPIKLVWNLKTPAPVPRFLHSAVLMEGLMLVFGGNTHNDTAHSYGAKCFSADFLAYDISCNEWHTMRKPPNLYLDIARYGHRSLVHDGAMYVVGGFNGKMLGSVLRYHPGECKSLSQEDCIATFPGRKCMWNRILSRCETINDHDKKSFDVCPPVTVKHNLTALCSEQSSCLSCVFNTYKCYWCGSTCTHNKCLELSKPEGVMSLRNVLLNKEGRRPTKVVVAVVSGEGCEDSQRSKCKSLDTCPLCHAHQYCDWENNQCDVTHNGTKVTLESPAAAEPEPNLPGIEQSEHRRAFGSGTSNALHSHRPCEPTCAQRTSCKNCTETKGSCMWCFNQRRCVNNNSYLVSFPYGQCREWTTELKRCPKFESEKDVEYSRCSDHQTCHDCQADVACGWCDDGSGTGIGSCMEGGQRGPINPLTSVTQPSKCPSTRWFFTQCPLCNCNGHSRCVNGSQCIMPCANNTAGSHCQHCIEKFFGKPINGGLCKPCDCNEHGDTCNRESGRCNCNTKGVTGDHCERCDTQNNYVGEPLRGSCFYDLQIDYQFTFNLSKHEDRHIRQINFFNVPTKSDVDTDFDILCSKAAKIKISAKTTKSHETWIIRNFTGTRIKRRFSASEYTFGSADNSTTFHVYVYNFTPPIEIIVSFSQHPKLDLIQFFSIFSLCFLILLTLAAILWKIKQKYDIYTRRQRLLVEMEAMASRPFRPILLELYPRGTGDDAADSVNTAYTQTCTTHSTVGNYLVSETNGTTNSLVNDHNIANTENLNSLLNSNTNCKTPHLNYSITNNINHKAVANATSPDSLSSELLESISTLKKGKKVNPSPIALEPCCGNRAAVLSLLVQLPTGAESYTPLGHPGGLAIASALVTLGNPRKSSTDPIALTKGDISKTKAVRGKQSYSSHSPDTCI